MPAWKPETPAACGMEHDPETPPELLMQQFQQGDVTAFDGIVSRFLAPALGVARQFVVDNALAEDAVQETFLRIVRSRARFIASMAFSTWFYAILRNVCRDMIRARGRLAKALSEIGERAAASAASPSSVSPDSESAAAASMILEGLPEQERIVLTLRILEGMPLVDVAVVLGISREAAKKRAHRGLRRLRARGLALVGSGERPPLSRSCD